MNKNTMNSLILIVSIFLSLSIGYYAGTKQSGSKNTASKILATYSVNGSKKTVELKDVSLKLGNDFADQDRMVYQQKRQAILDIVADDIRKNNDFSKIGVESVAPQEFEKMILSLKLDKKKLTEKQKSDIIGNLALANRNQKLKAVVDEKLKETNLKFQMEPPFEFVNSQQPGSLLIAGDSKNPIEVIFYGNMHCPQCSQTYQNMISFETQFPGKLKLYFKYLGLEPDGSLAFKTAKSLYCLPESQKKSGLVSKLMKAFFEKAPDSFESLSKILSENGVNSTDMERCLESKENNSMLRTDSQAGQELNRSVAAFYVINNRFVHGAEQKILIEDLIQYLLLTK